MIFMLKNFLKIVVKIKESINWHKHYIRHKLLRSIIFQSNYLFNSIYFGWYWRDEETDQRIKQGLNPHERWAFGNLVLQLPEKGFTKIKLAWIYSSVECFWSYSVSVNILLKDYFMLKWFRLQNFRISLPETVKTFYWSKGPNRLAFGRSERRRFDAFPLLLVYSRGGTVHLEVPWMPVQTLPRIVCRYDEVNFSKFETFVLSTKIGQPIYKNETNLQK